MFHTSKLKLSPGLISLYYCMAMLIYFQKLSFFFDPPVFVFHRRAISEEKRTNVIQTGIACVCSRFLTFNRLFASRATDLLVRTRRVPQRAHKVCGRLFGTCVTRLVQIRSSGEVSYHQEVDTCPDHFDICL